MGGRGASSSKKTKLDLAKEVARELYGKYISDVVAERYARGLIKTQDGEEIENNRDYEKVNGVEVHSKYYFEEWLKELKKNK